MNFDDLLEFNKIINKDFHNMVLVVYNLILFRRAYINNYNIVIADDNGNDISYEARPYSDDKMYISRFTLLKILNTEELMKSAIQKYINRDNTYYNILRFAVNMKRLPNEIDSPEEYQYIEMKVTSYLSGKLTIDYQISLEKIPYWRWSYIELSKEYINYDTVVKLLLSSSNMLKNDYIILSKLIKNYNDHFLKDVYKDMVKMIINEMPYMKHFIDFSSVTFPKAINILRYINGLEYESEVVEKILLNYKKLGKNKGNKRYNIFLYKICKYLYLKDPEIKKYVDNI